MQCTNTTQHRTAPGATSLVGLGFRPFAYLGAIQGDHTVQAVELDEQCVRVPLNMSVVLGQQLQQQLHLILHDGID